MINTIGILILIIIFVLYFYRLSEMQNVDNSKNIELFAEQTIAAVPQQQRKYLLNDTIVPDESISDSIRIGDDSVYDSIDLSSEGLIPETTYLDRLASVAS